MRFLVVLGVLLSVEVSAGSILITNAALHTMRDDTVLNDADILINDGVIEAIGTDLESTADVIIDAAGMPVTPALFAGVTSHGLTEVGAVSESVDGRLYDVAVGNLHPEFDVKRAYTPHSSLINVTRIEGFGYALLAASSSDSSVSGTGSMVEFDGGYESFSGNPCFTSTLMAEAHVRWVALGRHIEWSSTVQWLTFRSVMENGSISVTPVVMR